MVEERLLKAIQSGRAPHAVLITGPEDAGKRALARRAAALFCLGEDAPERWTAARTIPKRARRRSGWRYIRSLLSSAAMQGFNGGRRVFRLSQRAEHERADPEHAPQNAGGTARGHAFDSDRQRVRPAADRPLALRHRAHRRKKHRGNGGRAAAGRHGRNRRAVLRVPCRRHPRPGEKVRRAGGGRVPRKRAGAAGNGRVRHAPFAKAAALATATAAETETGPREKGGKKKKAGTLRWPCAC